MKYIDVAWKHKFESEPARLVSELNAQRYETRKLEFFLNGQVGYASSTGKTPGTDLGQAPVPALEKINSDPQFKAVEISNQEFELLWAKYSAST